jgi:hypothetical protein
MWYHFSTMKIVEDSRQKIESDETDEKEEVGIGGCRQSRLILDSVGRTKCVRVEERGRAGERRKGGADGMVFTITRIMHWREITMVIGVGTINRTIEVLSRKTI